MYLTADDGRTYKASINEYCKIQCDFLAYSRVIPEGPTVHINKESDFTLRTSGIEQPSAVRFYIQNYESGTSSGFDVITRDGSTYQIPSALDSGEYLIDILAFWDDNTISIHRFKMNID